LGAENPDVSTHQDLAALTKIKTVGDTTATSVIIHTNEKIAYNAELFEGIFRRWGILTDG
jgi:Holliday junction resolvasome RuvABC DNA-binding subunit